MSSVIEHLKRCKEKRIAREQARIERLRELNLKKYGKTDFQTDKKNSIPVTSKQAPNCKTIDTVTTNAKSNTAFKDITKKVISGKPVENLNGKNGIVSAKVEVKPNTKSKHSKESVFDRLYKPKVIPKQSNDNNFKQKIFKPGNILKTLNSKKQKITSAVTSAMKNVKFQTPVHFNTPKPKQLQTRLQKWMQKRGKSKDSYHHLQCFVQHHLTRDIKPLNIVDENQENKAVKHNIDINDEKGLSTNKSQQVNDSVDSHRDNESYESTLNTDAMHNDDDLMLGALNDLTDLLREGFDLEECELWIRAIQDRYSFAPNKAAYWELKAKLEERRGHLRESVRCWVQAIETGAEVSVVHAYLNELTKKLLLFKIPRGVK